MIDIIKQGKTIKSSQIEEMTGLKGTEIRRQINRLRNAGVPIASGQDGYFYANNREELQHTINCFYSRIGEMMTAVKALEAIYPIQDSELNLFEEV